MSLSYACVCVVIKKALSISIKALLTAENYIQKELSCRQPVFVCLFDRQRFIRLKHRERAKATRRQNTHQQADNLFNTENEQRRRVTLKTSVQHSLYTVEY